VTGVTGGPGHTLAFAVPVGTVDRVVFVELNATLVRS
jgi:spermidine synthase